MKWPVRARVRMSVTAPDSLCAGARGLPQLREEKAKLEEKWGEEKAKLKEQLEHLSLKYEHMTETMAADLSTASLNNTKVSPRPTRWDSA